MRSISSSWTCITRPACGTSPLSINPYTWGVQLARWSIEGVTSNTLYAQALTLIFKDGEIYQAPLSDELPLAIDLGKLPADEQSFVFYAALPVVKAHGGNLASGEAPYDDTRYSPFDAQTLDLYTDALSTNVSYMRKNCGCCRISIYVTPTTASRSSRCVARRTAPLKSTRRSWHRACRSTLTRPCGKCCAACSAS